MISTVENLARRSGSPLDGIESLCAQFDEQADKLQTLIDALEADLEAVKQKHLAGLKRQAAVVARRESELVNAIEASPSLFVKPRTITLHGIKVGFTRTDGKIVFDDPETVVKLIKKLHKDDAGTYIRTTEEPNKDALWTLPTVELARIGCRIEGAGDLVVCKRVAGDVEKLIKRLIEKMVEA